MTNTTTLLSPFSQRALHWRTNRMIDDEYHNCIASNLHLRVQIKNELCEMSVRLMMKEISKD